MKNRWYVIVNPKSGRGKGLKDWPVINSLLREAGVQFDANFTMRKFHAVEMTFQAIEAGYRNIIAVGGDGTVHEIVQGIMMQKAVPSTDITIALFPMGTGNDWVRMYGVPKSYNEIVRSICLGNTFLQDVGKVNYTESMVRHTRYLCNAGGIAYDAAVCNSVNRLKSKGYRGAWLYIFSGLTQALGFANVPSVIKCDGREVFRGKIFMTTIGIGRYNGGGMAQTPLASLDDGLFDMTVIPKMNRLRLFSRFRALYTENIYNVRGIKFFRAQKIEIECERDTGLELDGEDLGCRDFSFEVIHRAIRVIVRQEFIPL